MHSEVHMLDRMRLIATLNRSVGILVLVVTVMLAACQKNGGSGPGY